MSEEQKRNLERCSSYIEKIVIPRHVLGFLTPWLPQEAVERIQAEELKGATAATAMLLKYLLQLEAEGWFRGFLDGLSAAGYTGLSQAIEEWDFEKIESLEAFRGLLRTIEPSVKNEIDPRNIITHLTSCIIERDIEEIRQMVEVKGPIAGAEKLIDCLLRSDKEEWPKTFTIALENERYDNVLQLWDLKAGTTAVNTNWLFCLERNTLCTNTDSSAINAEGTSQNNSFHNNNGAINTKYTSTTKMMSLLSLLDAPESQNNPNQLQVKVNVIKCSRKTNYKNAKGESRVLYHLALADTTAAIKAKCYNEEIYCHSKPSYGLLITNFILNINTIVITKQTKVSRVTPLRIPTNIQCQAEQLLGPPPLPTSPLKTAKISTIKTLLSVAGTVQEIHPTRMVHINGQQTEVKTIKIQDATDSIKVSLWREAAYADFSPGDYVLISNVTVSQFNGEKILNTTRISRLKVTAAPPETLQIEIVGLENSQATILTITTRQLQSDTLQSMDINTDILLNFLLIEPNTEKPEDLLVNELPVKCEIVFCNGKIQEISKSLT